jgi:LDH2 family malate/lactate/ureidoglycolate dehydrogenase
MKYLDSHVLRPILQSELQLRRVVPESASHVAQSLVETSTRGVDSHGINLFPYYVSAIEGGRINPTPRFTWAARKPSVAVLNADHGFGHHAGSTAMDAAVEMASQTGIGAVSVRESTHFGAAAYFALQASRRGYLAFAFTNADALVRVHDGRTAFFGTNPICFCAPMDGEDPFCLDMATSQVSWNKIVNKRDAGELLPIGWACDQEGESTIEPGRAAMLEPIGEYKGYGLGMMVEILCAVLAGGPLGRDLLPMYGSPLNEQRAISHFFVAINIVDFVDAKNFTEQMTELARRIRGLRPRGKSPVMISGDPEKHNYRKRQTQGIPIEDAKYAQFLQVSAEFKKAAL